MWSALRGRSVKTRRVRHIHRQKARFLLGESLCLLLFIWSLVNILLSDKSQYMYLSRHLLENLANPCLWYISCYWIFSLFCVMWIFCIQFVLTWTVQVLTIMAYGKEQEKNTTKNEGIEAFCRRSSIVEIVGIFIKLINNLPFWSCIDIFSTEKSFKRADIDHRLN